MKNYLTSQIFLLTAFALFLVSCSKTETVKTVKEPCATFKLKPIFNTNNITDLPTLDYKGTVCGVMPLGAGYKWIYQDSLFDNNGQFVSKVLDTVYIEKTIQSLADNGVWWKIKSNRYKGLPNYVFTTDSVVYNMDLPFSNGNRVYTAYPWLQVLPQDSVRKGNFVSDIAYIETTKKITNRTVSVPAGNFSNCINTVKHLSHNYDITFKPEVGIVKFVCYEVVGNPFNMQPAHKRQVSELVQVIQ